MSKPETIKDLLSHDVTLGDVRKIAAALWNQNAVASKAFPAPYKVSLPDFNSLPEHVQGFIVKGLLDSKVEATFVEKSSDPVQDEEGFGPASLVGAEPFEIGHDPVD